jgi:hypothetical protein
MVISKDDVINLFAVCKPAKPAPTIIILVKFYLPSKVYCSLTTKISLVQKKISH